MARENRARRALVIDDDPDVRSLVRSLCESARIDLDEAANGRDGLSIARRRPPDVILLDLVLPDGDGTEIAKTLREDPQLATVPLVVLSARRTQESKLAAFEAGADDYVVKPFSLAEIDARIRANLRKRELYERLELMNLELRLANERLSELATTDALTGLCNVRHLRERLRDEYLRAERYETTLALVMIDLDGFKAVNDTHGHAAGDRLLSQLAQRMKAQARATDVVARYGGDEFAILLPHTSLAEAVQFAERLCDRVARAPLRLSDGSPSAVGLSCGVAAWPECRDIELFDELLGRADEALYRAKREGGGAVAAAPPRVRRAGRIGAVGAGRPSETDTKSFPPSRSPRGAGG
ncbi:MAG: diguanylate cyclase [Acidobacteriota bacterium]|nr:diguanylate cyclase [Acidobacteriota bacterium]